MGDYMKGKVNWKALINILFIFVSVGIIAYLCLSENGLTDLIKNITNFDKTWLSMSVVCYLLNIVIDIYLIYVFIKVRYSKYRVRDAIKCSMIGQFYSAVTPGASGGQPMQIFVLSKQGVDPGSGTASLIQKFLVYQTTLTSLSALAILICQDTINGPIKGLAFLGFFMQAVVIVLLFLFSFNKTLTKGIISFIFNLLGKIKILKNADKKIKELENQLECFHESNKELYKNRSLVLKTYVLTAVQLTTIFIVPYCIYRAFNFSGVRVIDMVGTQAFVTMVSSFMPLPGGSGAAEGSFYVMFKNYFSDETIKSAMLLWRLITYYLVILISSPFSGMAKNKKIDNKD